MRLAHSVSAFLQSSSAWSLSIALLLLMVLLNPPNGVLNDNEQHYFEVAHALVAPQSTAATESVVGGVPHTFAFGWLTGSLIEWLGYEGAQIAGRLLVAALYAWALTTFFLRLNLGVAEAASVTLVFYSAGQQLMGGEWMFGGLEPKTLAYPFIVLGLASYFARQRFAPWLWLAVATTFHFQLGGLWFGLVVLCDFLWRRPLKEAMTGAAIYALGVVPIALVVVLNHGDLVAGAGPDTGPDVSWIVTFYRSAHHTTPFVSLSSFVADWIPGLFLMVPLTVLSAWLMLQRESAAARPATLAFVAFAFLWLAFVASAFDSEGRLGPYVLFRPSSLALFVFLAATAIYLRDYLGAAGWRLRFAALLLVGFIAAPAVALDAVQPVRADRQRLAQQSGLLEFARGTPQSSVFLIQRELEPSLLGFQRETQRPVAVLFKFAPSRSADLREWYRRQLMQQELLKGDCEAGDRDRVSHVIVLAGAAPQGFLPCGSIVYEDRIFAVYAVTRS